MFQGDAAEEWVAELELTSAKSLLGTVDGDGGGSHGEDDTVRASKGSG